MLDIKNTINNSIITFKSLLLFMLLLDYYLKIKLFECKILWTKYYLRLK